MLEVQADEAASSSSAWGGQAGAWPLAARAHRLERVRAHRCLHGIDKEGCTGSGLCFSCPCAKPFLREPETTEGRNLAHPGLMVGRLTHLFRRMRQNSSGLHPLSAIPLRFFQRYGSKPQSIPIIFVVVNIPPRLAGFYLDLGPSRRKYYGFHFLIQLL